eukprot:30897-Pelagococcus_subviridis.AAC.18
MSSWQVAINQDLTRKTSASDILVVVSSHVADFNLVNCTTALQRLARSTDGRRLLQYGGDSSALAVLNGLLDAAVTRIRQQQPHEVESRTSASLLHACGKLGIGLSRRVGTLVNEIEKSVNVRASRFNPQELSNSLWGVAKLGFDHESDIVLLLGEAISTSLSDELRSLKRTVLHDEHVWLSRSVGWTEQGVSNVAWSLATLGFSVDNAHHAEILIATFTAVSALATRFNPQELANVLWAAAKTVTTGARDKNEKDTNETDNHRKKMVMKTRAAVISATSVIVSRIDSTFIARQRFEPRHVANIAWACAKLGLDIETGRGDDLRGGSIETVFSALAMAVVRVASHMNTQELSMCAWALAAFGVVDGTFAVAEAFASQANKATPRQLATTVAALAKLGEGGDGYGTLFDAVADAVISFPDPIKYELKPQDVANLAWAFAKLGRKKQLMFNYLSEVFAAQAVIDVKVTAYSPKQVSMILWAFATLDIQHQTLLTAAIPMIKARAHEFNPRDLTNTAWALDSLGVKSLGEDRLIRKIGRAARRRLADFNSQELLKFLGAHGRLGGYDKKLNAAVSAQRKRSYDFPSLGSRDSCSIVTLTSRIPMHYGNATVERVDDSCHGWGRGDTGVTLWEGSFVLAEWLSRALNPRHSNEISAAMSGHWSHLASDTWEGRVGVELGAGLGLPSIVAAKLGLEMVSTDGTSPLLRLRRGFLFR